MNRVERHMDFSALVSALGATPSGSGYIARCPAHNDRNPSLSITQGRDGRALLFCHAGCDFQQIRRALDWRQPTRPVCLHHAENPAREEHPPPVEVITKLLRELEGPDETVVDRYLRQRGIKVGVADDVAYHEAILHRPTRTVWPAMICVVRDVHNHVVALHRTYLTQKRPITKAPVEPNRMMLGSVRGHAVHLASASSSLILGEGVETTLSAMQMLGLPGWAALSAGNLEHVALPDCVTEVVLAADNDTPGITKAIKAAQRFRREGREVHVLKPAKVNDFNDLYRRE